MIWVNRFVLISWIAFWIYWLISAGSAKKNAPTNHSRPVGIKIVILILIIIALKSSFFRDHNLSESNVYLVALGLILFISGLALAIWARLNLGKNWGMPMTQKEKPELVTSGPYGFIRHPIYSGILLASLGTAFAVGLYWLVPFVALSIYFVYSAFMEEKNLAALMPNSYPKYKKKTKMLVPFIF